MSTVNNLKLAWFSPIIDSANSAASRFSRVMLENLPEGVSIDLFLSDTGLSSLEKSPNNCDIFSRFNPRHYLRADNAELSDSYDTYIFQIEDGEQCAFVFDAMFRFPGIVHFHQYHLPELVEKAVLHRLAGKKQKCEDQGLSEKLRDFKDRGWESKERQVAISGRAIELPGNSLIFVNDCFAADDLESKIGPGNSVYTTSYPIDPKERSLELSDESVLKIAFRGEYVTEDRLYSLFEGISQFISNSSNKPFELCWLVTNSNELEASARKLKRFTDYFPALAGLVNIESVSSDSELSECLVNTHLFISLRCDVIRGVPHSVYRAIECGVPVITTDVGFTGVLAEELVIKAPYLSGAEGQCLAEVLCSFNLDRSLLTKQSRLAANSAKEFYSSSNSWVDYLEAISRDRGKILDNMESWNRELCTSREKMLDYFGKPYEC